jgi:uncharacterized protein (DUF2249 family)
MDAVPFATTRQDSDARGIVEQRHAELAGALTARTAALSKALHDGREWPAHRDEVATWCGRVLMPYFDGIVSRASAMAHRLPRFELLLRGLRHEQALLQELIARLRAVEHADKGLVEVGALRTLASSHLAKLDGLLLPALAEEPGCTVADLLEVPPPSVGAGGADRQGVETAGTRGAPGDQAAGSACGCHEEPGRTPELDARAVPHAIRHATVLGALDAVEGHATLDLLAPHDPIPLLAQIDQRWPDGFDVEYLERGPETWRLRFTRCVTRDEG